MSKELKITKERVIAAANKCRTAKDVLKELFPDVFGKVDFAAGNIVENRAGDTRIIIFSDGKYYAYALRDGSFATDETGFDDNGYRLVAQNMQEFIDHGYKIR